MPAFIIEPIGGVVLASSLERAVEKAARQLNAREMSDFKDGKKRLLGVQTDKRAYYIKKARPFIS